MKTGFTLIELLAVIVILAIIAVIAVPIVITIINDIDESSVLRSADFYLDGVETSIATSTFKGIKVNDGKYSIMEDGNICIGVLSDSTCTGDILKVEMDGEVPSSGKINFESRKPSTASLKYGDQTIVMYYNGEISLLEEPKSFAEDSWDVIATNVIAGNLSKYKVGDTKEITLTGFTNKETDSNGLYTVRIANTSTPEECKAEGFSQTACGFVIEFVDIITTHNMNPSGEYKGTQYNYGWNVDGYPASAMYTYIQNDIYNALPEELKRFIIPTFVVSGHGSTSGETNFVSEDKVYLLSTAEIWEQGTSNTINFDTVRVVTRQLDYYNDLGVTTSNYSGAIKKLNGTSRDWWLRSAKSDHTGSFYRVLNTGYWNHHHAFNTNGVAVAFRIG